jgi:hypothetical protein
MGSAANGLPMCGDIQLDIGRAKRARPREQNIDARAVEGSRARPVLNVKVDLSEPSLWEAPAYGRRHHTTVERAKRAEITH